MAKASSAALLVLAVLALSCFAQLGSAARKVPAEAVSAATTAEASADVKHPDTLQEGTVLIPGIGRYMIGSHWFPDIGGLDHSIPAAVNGQYLPGADDTFVPNPGFEVPNPFHPSSSTP